MFFTREDILKIQNALLQLSVKDSELPSAEYVTYDDTLSIVQESKNKQIKIKDFFNQISLWKREDFINITDKYDEHYISLIEAIKLVPILQRKDGLVITFQDIEGNWEIYQFRGNITEFFEEDKWFNLYDYRNNIIQSIVPDEEDLTASIPNKNGNSLVSLKDRTYNPASFSGKGYKILRKNIVDGNNILTQDMINQDNTIYVIRYDFALGEDITVPANCVLDFDGGSIASSNTLTLTNTLLTGNIKVLCPASGIITNKNITPIAFGAKGDGETNDTLAFKSAVDVCDNIYVPNGTYILDSGNQYDRTNIGIVIQRSNVHIKMDNGAILKSAQLELVANNPFRNIITITGPGVVDGKDVRIENVTIEGGTIIGSRDQYTLPQTAPDNYHTYENYCGIVILFCNNITIKNCTITDFIGDCIYTGGVDNIQVIDCTLKRCRRGCFSIGLNKNVHVQNCVFDNPTYVQYGNGNYSYATLPASSICFEPEPSTLRAINSNPVQHTIIENCIFNSPSEGGSTSINGSGTEDLIIRNNIFNNGDRYNIYLKSEDLASDPNFKSKNLTFENNIINATEFHGSTKDDYIFLVSTIKGNIILKGNKIKNCMLADFQNYTTLYVEDNVTKNCDTLIYNITPQVDVESEVYIRGNKGEAITLCNLIFGTGGKIYIKGNVLTATATNLRSRQQTIGVDNTNDVFVEDNNFIIPVPFFVRKSVTNTGKLLIKNNIIEFNGNTIWWFDTNGNMRYVKADLINNYIKTSYQSIINQGDFSLKMNVINNVFAGGETQFTQDTIDTDHLKLSGNIYLG